MKKFKQHFSSKAVHSFVAAALCISMAFSTGCSSNAKNTKNQDTSKASANSTGVPEYLNTGGTLPIVKEGFKKGFTLAVPMAANAGRPEDMWAYNFMTKAMNIDVTVKAFTMQNKTEFMSLMFASNDVPDIIFGAGLSPVLLMRYGQEEKQLMDLSPYLNATYMPYLTKIYQQTPEWKNVVANSEGKVYSLGYINNPSDQGQIARMFYNYDWLDKLGLKVPGTLDEFINMLRAFKKLGNNIVPIGGSYKETNSTLSILNALGYITENPKGLSIALREDKVVLPVADRAAYGKYLEVMNTIYKEGLIDKDFYTMDANAVKASISEGRNGVIAQAPFVYTQKFNEWWGAQPLTSEFNKKACWPTSITAITTGNFVVSSNCKAPELAAVFADWFFDPDSKNYTLFTNGAPSKETKILYGTTGWTVDDSTRNTVFSDYENNKKTYASQSDYLAQKVQLVGFRKLGYGYWSSVGTWSFQLLAGYPADKCTDGYPDKSKYTGKEPFRHTLTNGETHFRMALKDTLVDKVVEGYPSVVYFDAEKNREEANLITIIKEYAEQESAKFIIGARPLSEINSYFDEIERLGAKKYVKLYDDYYQALKANKK